MFSLIRPVTTSFHRDLSAPLNMSGHDFDFTIIKNPVTITRILNQMHFASSKVSIHVEDDNGDTRTFHSTISRVDRKQRQIIIHQLQPKGWLQVANSGQKVEVNCFMSSGQLSFYSTLSSLDASRENYYSVLALPDEVSKFQLRSAYRVFMPPGTCKVSLVLRDAAGSDTRMDAVGMDLSLDGSCLRFIGDVLSLLPEEKVLHDLQFDVLSGKVQFSSTARICRLTASQGGQTIAGIRFLPLPEPVKKQLETALAEVQRQQLRQQIRIY